MENACPRCGHTKTESVRHGFVYNTLWDMGYHLRRCSFCNRKRVFKRDRSRPHPNDLTAEELTESFNRKIARASGRPYATPYKGVTGTMASNNTSDGPQEPAAQAARSAVAVEEAASEVEDYRLCPKCGSTAYRRSRRRWYEKLIKRPRMARCLRCDHRFPYPH